jgi:hypothetical protein
MSVANGTFTRTQSFTPEKGGVVPRFFLEQVEDPVASQREGRPIFFDQERVELLTPGNVLNIPVEIVNNSHRDKYPEAYKRFKDGMEMATTGTPLEQWPILKPAMVRELKAMNLFTVEHVADMNDHAVQRMMGGLRLRNLAKAYLDDAAASALLSRTTADNERKDAEIAELRNKVDELSALLNRVHSDMQSLKNAPNAVASHVPGMHDPVEAMKAAQAHQGMHDSSARSSLESLPDIQPRQRRQKSAEAPAA